MTKKFKVYYYVYEREDKLNDANEIASIRHDKLNEITIEADGFMIEDRILIFKDHGEPVASFSSWENVIKIND